MYNENLLHHIYKKNNYKYFEIKTLWQPNFGTMRYQSFMFFGGNGLQFKKFCCLVIVIFIRLKQKVFNVQKCFENKFSNFLNIHYWKRIGYNKNNNSSINNRIILIVAQCNIWTGFHYFRLVGRKISKPISNLRSMVYGGDAYHYGNINQYFKLKIFTFLNRRVLRNMSISILNWIFLSCWIAVF